MDKIKQKATIDNVVSIVNANTYLRLEDQTSNTAFYSTRRHGNIGDETPGMEDVLEAKKAKLLLKDAFDNLEFEFETVDEWVHLNIIVK